MSAAVSIHLKRFLVLLVVCLVVTVTVTVPLAAQGDEALWYKTELINPGLGVASSDVDRSSPRAALRSFVELIEAGDLTAAARVLNLSEFTKNKQQTLGSQLAAKLLSILDRKLEIEVVAEIRTSC